MGREQGSLGLDRQDVAVRDSGAGSFDSGRGGSVPADWLRALAADKAGRELRECYEKGCSRLDGGKFLTLDGGVLIIAWLHCRNTASVS